LLAFLIVYFVYDSYNNNNNIDKRRFIFMRKLVSW